MIKKILKMGFYSVSLFTLITACQKPKEAILQQSTDLTTFVDQRIGTGGHGHVFMGANVPFGFVQLGPTSILESWDWCSGYNIADSTVIGFSHTHLSGTGIGDLADVTLMPVVGSVIPGRGTVDQVEAGQASLYKHTSESYRPGFYAVHLDRYDVKVELTATTRTGLHQYTYPTTDQKTGVIIDLENGTCWDKATSTLLKQVDAQTLIGQRNSKGWADNQQLSFAITFNKPFTDISYYNAEGKVMNAKDLQAKDNQMQVRYARVNFDMQANHRLEVKVGLSPVSTTLALQNIKDELPSWDFNAVAQAAHTDWNTALQKVQATSSDTTILRNFYTALYHTMIAPSVFMDPDGSYRGADGQVYQDTTFTNYTTFSLWDTYRALHPLMTIIQPERVNDMVNTMLHIYDQQGKLPVWHLMGCETNCMVGNPAISVVADAMLKGFDGFDKQHALEAMKNTAMLDERGQIFRKKYGFIPSDLYNESIANDMEYAIADASLSKAAKAEGDAKAADYFGERSHSWMHYFDKQTNLQRGRFVNNSWRTPFDPFYAQHRDCDYTEGNAFQYTWLVPHDLDRLVELMGGKEKTLQQLDSLFTVSSKLNKGASPDMSGLIGQYVHGNEPSHHILYFYTLLGQPAKGAEKLREVMTTLYTNAPEGLSGNEDVGQMSAWYILSSMGLYQVDPAGGTFVFGSPMLDEAMIRLPLNKTFRIVAHNNSATNKYVKAITLNGKAITGPSIDYKEIMNGGELVFEMTNVPTSWQSQKYNK